MAHSRYSSSYRRVALLHDETRAAALEVALIVSAICLITLVAFHLIGINPGKIIDIVFSSL